MTPFLDRILKVLAPLVVLGAVAAVLLSGTDRTGSVLEDRGQASILARWSVPSERDDVRAEIGRYLKEREEDAEARWFAVDAYAHVLDPVSALAAWEAVPAFRDAPGSAGRFALTMLRHLDFRYDDPTQGTMLVGRCLQARIEGGDEDAPQLLSDLVAKATEVHLLRFYGPFHRSPTSAADMLSRAFLARSELAPFFAAGAVLAARPGDDRHAERLRALLASDWRTTRPFMWMHIARALGVVGDAASVEALRATRAALSGDDDRTARQRRGLDAALALAGDEGARRRLHESLSDPAADPEGAYLALGLGVQWASGDPAAAGRLVDLWRTTAGPITRLQIAMSLLAADRDPSADFPVDAWARELAGSESRATRALARGFLLRRKAPGALEALLAGLREDLPLLDEVELHTLDGDAGSGVVEALRALARWS